MNKMLSILLACSMVLPYTNFLAFANENEVILAEEPVTVEQEVIDIELEEELPVEEIREEPEPVSIDDTLVDSPYSAKYGELIASGNHGTNWYIYDDGTLVIEAGGFSSTSGSLWYNYRDYVEHIIIEPANGTDKLVLNEFSSYLFANLIYLQCH